MFPPSFSFTYYLRLCFVRGAHFLHAGATLCIPFGCDRAPWGAVEPLGKAPRAARAGGTAPRCGGRARQRGAAERVFSGWRSGD